MQCCGQESMQRPQPLHRCSRTAGLGRGGRVIRSLPGVAERRTPGRPAVLRRLEPTASPTPKVRGVAGRVNGSRGSFDRPTIRPSRRGELSRNSTLPLNFETVRGPEPRPIYASSCRFAADCGRRSYRNSTFSPFAGRPRHCAFEVCPVRAIPSQCADSIAGPEPAPEGRGAGPVLADCSLCMRSRRATLRRAHPGRWVP